MTDAPPNVPAPPRSDDIDGMATFLRARWADERNNASAHTDSYNDVDGCWGLHTDPADLLADIAAKEALLTDLLAEKHTVCDDHWYTCCAATEERDGSECPRSDHDHIDRCTCGLTDRTVRRLRILVSAYTDADLGGPDA